jgi:hypothetical protein
MMRGRSLDRLGLQGVESRHRRKAYETFLNTHSPLQLRKGAATENRTLFSRLQNGE